MSSGSKRPPPPLEVPETVRRLLDGSVDAAVVLDGERRLLYWNSAYQQYTGLRPRQLLRAAEAGTCCFETFPIEVCQTLCLGHRALTTARTVRMDEIRARRGDGEELTSSSPPLPSSRTGW